MFQCFYFGYQIGDFDQFGFGIVFGQYDMGYWWFFILQEGYYFGYVQIIIVQCDVDFVQQYYVDGGIVDQGFGFVLVCLCGSDVVLLVLCVLSEVFVYCVKLVQFVEMCGQQVLFVGVLCVFDELYYCIGYVMCDVVQDYVKFG